MNFKTKGNYYVGQASSPESTASICVKIEVYNCLNGQLYKDKFPLFCSPNFLHPLFLSPSCFHYLVLFNWKNKQWQCLYQAQH